MEFAANDNSQLQIQYVSLTERRFGRVPADRVLHARARPPEGVTPATLYQYISAARTANTPGV